MNFKTKRTIAVPGIAAGVLGISALFAPTLTHASTISVADQAAIKYVDAHYPGQGQARVLRTQRDTGRGRPVYDIRILAPNGTTYVLHMLRANYQVPWVSRAERQYNGHAYTTSNQTLPTRSTSGKSPDLHTGKSLDRHTGTSADRHTGKSPDRHMGTSPDRHTGKSPDRHMGTSPDRHTGKSPDRKSPHRRGNG